MARIQQKVSAQIEKGPGGISIPGSGFKPVQGDSGLGDLGGALFTTGITMKQNFENAEKASQLSGLKVDAIKQFAALEGEYKGRKDYENFGDYKEKLAKLTEDYKGKITYQDVNDSFMPYFEGKKAAFGSGIESLSRSKFVDKYRVSVDENNEDLLNVISEFPEYDRVVELRNQGLQNIIGAEATGAFSELEANNAAEKLDIGVWDTYFNRQIELNPEAMKESLDDFNLYPGLETADRDAWKKKTDTAVKQAEVTRQKEIKAAKATKDEAVKKAKKDLENKVSNDIFEFKLEEDMPGRLEYISSLPNTMGKEKNKLLDEYNKDLKSGGVKVSDPITFSSGQDAIDLAILNNTPLTDGAVINEFGEGLSVTRQQQLIKYNKDAQINNNKEAVAAQKRRVNLSQVRGDFGDDKDKSARIKSDILIGMDQWITANPDKDPTEYVNSKIDLVMEEEMAQSLLNTWDIFLSTEQQVKKDIESMGDDDLAKQFIIDQGFDVTDFADEEINAIINTTDFNKYKTGLLK